MAWQAKCSVCRAWLSCMLLIPCKGWFSNLCLVYVGPYDLHVLLAQAAFTCVCEQSKPACPNRVFLVFICWNRLHGLKVRRTSLGRHREVNRDLTSICLYRFLWVRNPGIFVHCVMPFLGEALDLSPWSKPDIGEVWCPILEIWLAGRGAIFFIPHNFRDHISQTWHAGPGKHQIAV